jgi:hypothetical protein
MLALSRQGGDTFRYVRQLLTDQYTHDRLPIPADLDMVAHSAVGTLLQMGLSRDTTSGGGVGPPPSAHAGAPPGPAGASVLPMTALPHPPRA